MESSNCPNCGARRLGAFRFCRECQYDYELERTANPAPAREPVAPVPPVPSSAPAAREPVGPATAFSLPAPDAPRPAAAPPRPAPAPPPASGSNRRRAIAAILGGGLLLLVLAVANLGNPDGGEPSPAASTGSATGASAQPSPTATALIAPPPDGSAGPTPTLGPTEAFSIREPADGSFAGATVVVRGTGPAKAIVTGHGEVGDPVNFRIGSDLTWELEMSLKPGLNDLAFELNTVPGIQLRLTVTREESGP